MKGILKKLIEGVVTLLLRLIINGALIMWMWNWIMPDIFGLPTVSYLQSIGVFVLSNILFNNDWK